MRITIATHRGFGYGLKSTSQGYGNNREQSLDRRQGAIDIGPDGFLALEEFDEPHARPKKKITLAKVSILEPKP